MSLVEINDTDPGEVRLNLRTSEKMKTFKSQGIRFAKGEGGQKKKVKKVNMVDVLCIQE
jgi:hypothetical protein